MSEMQGYPGVFYNVMRRSVIAPELNKDNEFIEGCL
jgi:hypothetical protein